ncbi:unnamed protein product [Closterium sp. NIES-54]
MENLMYKDWKAENEAKIGMRFREVSADAGGNRQEQQRQKEQHETVAPTLLPPQTQTPCSPQEAPRAAIDEPLGQSLTWQEQEEEEQPHAAHSLEVQHEKELQALAQCTANYYGSPARPSLCAVLLKPPAAYPLTSVAIHLPRHDRNRDLPSCHHDRHGGQASSPVTGDAGENRDNASTSHARHGVLGSEADGVDGQETDDAEPDGQQEQM